MTPEMAWLCAAVADHTLPPPAGLNPQRLVVLLRHHRLAAALGEHAAAYPFNSDQSAPPGALAELARHARLQGLRRAGVLGQIATAFASAGVRMVAVKGPAFAARILGDPVLRDGRDLDVLISPDARCAAQRVLAEMGYHPEPGRDLIRHHSIELLAGPGAPRIELHCHLAPDPRLFPLTVLDPFARAVPARIGAVAVPTLPDQDAVIFAAYHGFRHAWARLFWLADLHTALCGPASAALDWPAMLARAAQLGCRGHLESGLVLVRELFGAALPIRPGPLAERAGRALRPVLTGSPVIDRAAMHRVGLVRYVLLDLAMQTAPGGRWALLAEHARPTPHDRAWVSLPPWADHLYWLVRPLRLLLGRGAAK